MSMPESQSTRTATPTQPTCVPARICLREAMRLLDNVARNVRRQVGDWLDVEELKAFAHEALTEVLARFDPSRGVEFGAYARVRLRGAIIDGLRKESGLPRGVGARLRSLQAADLFVETNAEEQNDVRAARDADTADARLAALLRGIATASAVGLVCGGHDNDGEEYAHPNSQRGSDPELFVQRAELRRVIERALRAVGGKEADILRRHYLEDQDLQDAAAEMGLSKSWGSRLHARGIEILAEKLRELRVEQEC